MELFFCSLYTPSRRWQEQLYLSIACYIFLSFSTQSEIWWLPFRWICVKSSFVATDLRLRMFTKRSLQPPPTSPTCTLRLILIEWLHEGHVVSHTKGWQVYISKHFYICTRMALRTAGTPWYACQHTIFAYRQRCQKSKICRFLAYFGLSVQLSTVPAKMLQNKKAVYNKSPVLGACVCWSLLVLFPSTGS